MIYTMNVRETPSIYNQKPLPPKVDLLSPANLLDPKPKLGACLQNLLSTLAVQPCIFEDPYRSIRFRALRL